MLQEYITTILQEIRTVLETVNEEEVEKLIRMLLNASKIITCGAGRVGMATRAFCMRLGHLGLQAYHWGDTTVPSLAQGDLLLIASGSGETQTVFDLQSIAVRSKARTALITGNSSSRMGQLADIIVNLKAPSKIQQNISGFASKQPMTTLNEQCLYLFYDALVLMLMVETGQTDADMKQRHSILE